MQQIRMVEIKLQHLPFVQSYRTCCVPTWLAQIFEGFPLVTALLSQMPQEYPIYGPSTLQYTGELCHGIEQITLSLAQY